MTQKYAQIFICDLFNIAPGQPLNLAFLTMFAYLTVGTLVVVLHVLSSCAAVEKKTVNYTESDLLKIPTTDTDTYEISNTVTKKKMVIVTPSRSTVILPFQIIKENGTRMIILPKQCFNFCLYITTPVGTTFQWNNVHTTLVLSSVCGKPKCSHTGDRSEPDHVNETIICYQCQPDARQPDARQPDARQPEDDQQDKNQRNHVFTGCSVAALVLLGLGLWWKFGKPSASRPHR